jgi:hypothetical protein
MKASWRTSVFGTGGLIFVLGSALGALLDGNPATNPDWALVFAAAAPCIGLLFARDNKVTSEDVGIK